MTDSLPLQVRAWTSRRTFFLGLLLFASIVLSALALILPRSNNQSSLQIAVGDVASQDILAPRTLSFQSEVLTAAAREESAAAIAPIYGPPNANVAREQVEKLTAALAFVESVREDSFASSENKLADLSALQNINLGQERAIDILALSGDAWLNVKRESVTVLEQIMRSTIREDRLESARITAPALVSLSLPENQAHIAAEFASAFVAANSFFSLSLTDAARDEARAGVEYLNRTFLNDETIVERGQVLTSADLEALEQFGLVQSESQWQDYVGIGALVLTVFSLIFLYMRMKIDQRANVRNLALISILFIIFLFSARIFITDRTVVPYMFPIASFALLVATIMGAQTAMVFSLGLSLLAAYDLPTSFELTLYYLIGSWIGILFLRNAQRLMAYFWAGSAISIAGIAILLAYRLPLASTDILGMATLMGAAILNGFASATLTIVLQLASAQFLGLTTTIQLQELARPDHPLLQFVLRNAPGTYQHSLQIANLAEQAAERIGANALLTRVGSLYHDAGKARQPIYFIENQVPGAPNPHDDLAPLESAQVIIRHVADGLKLAEKHRVPARIKDFIAEHHGTMLTRYQLGRAIEAAGGDKAKVDFDSFRYPGPQPASRETALVMLADGCEARTRAERPETRAKQEELVKDVLDQRLASGQLDQTSITMQDLHIIQESFVSTLRGIYHPRIAYPKIEDSKPREIQAGSIVDSNK